MSGTSFSNVNNIHVHSMIPEDQKKYYTMTQKHAEHQDAAGI